MDADSDEERLSEEYYPAGDGGWDLEADRVYWRRRFLLLCAGVVALGACAWLIPGAHAPSKRAAAEARRSVAALNSRLVLPTVAYGRAWASPTSVATSAVPASTGPASTGPANTGPAILATPYPVAGNHPSPTPGAVGAAPGTAPCARAGIVLSLFTSQASYPRGARPAFSVYAVSTRAAACTLAFGAGAVQVIVTRNGRVVWDSVACRPAPARPVRFTLGVPQMLTLAWNPEATTPSGCGGAVAASAPGTFDAVAIGYGRSSPVRVFRIAG